ncbi:MAG: PaaI family thioesterase [Halobacteriales archaeon]|nr:PaaI family thioesterase [Halobacteriales archaeon]
MERVPLYHYDGALRCFVCGPDNAHGLGVRYWYAGDHVEATWTANDHAEGWPGLLHGAGFAALHDDAAAWAMIAIACRSGFTTHMDVRFLKPIPLGAELRITGRVGEVGEKQGTFDSRIELPGGKLASTARTTYAFADGATIARLTGGKLQAQLQQWLAADDDGRRALLFRWSGEEHARRERA